MLALSILISLITYSTACLGLGELIFHALTYKINQINHLSAGTKLATSFILGQGFLANLWLLIALPGWFAPEVIVGIVLVLSVCGVIQTKRQIANISRQLHSIGYDWWTEPWGWRLLGILTLLICLFCLTSLGRPMSIDGAKVYMAFPKVVADTHRLMPLPGIYQQFSTAGFC